MTQLIPLSKLRLSDSNVRKSGATSIEAAPTSLKVVPWKCPSVTLMAACSAAVW